MISIDSCGAERLAEASLKRGQNSRSCYRSSRLSCSYRLGLSALLHRNSGIQLPILNPPALAAAS
jgi:hypothetical protein